MKRRFFLASKTRKDDAEGGLLELERSLKRLKTGHFDLYQLHCLQREDEVKQALGPGGVLEMIVKPKDSKKTVSQFILPGIPSYPGRPHRA